MPLPDTRYELSKQNLIKALDREVELTAANTLYLQLLQLAARRLLQGREEIREMLDLYDVASNPLTQQFFEMNQDVFRTIQAVFPVEENPPVSVFGTRAQTMALAAILAERKAQDAKWGYVEHDGPKWLSILMEEVGEMCQDINEGKDYKEELIQVAAVAMKWLEAIECKATQCPGEAI